MARELVMLGAGTVGRFARDICDALGLSIHGYLDDFKPLGESINGVPVLGPFSLIDRPEFVDGFDFLVALGKPRLRAKWGDIVRARGGRLVTLVHPTAVIAASARLGAGTIVQAFAYVHANARLAESVLIENHSSIGIDNVIGKGAHVTTGCMVNAFVTLGEYCFIGSGAVIDPWVAIGAGSIVGSNAAVTDDVPPGKVAVGVPARVIKDAPTAE